jgi:hypothetical protein
VLEVLRLVPPEAEAEEEQARTATGTMLKRLRQAGERCCVEQVDERPDIAQVVERLCAPV